MDNIELAHIVALGVIQLAELALGAYVIKILGPVMHHWLEIQLAKGNGVLFEDKRSSAERIIDTARTTDNEFGQ